MARSRKPKPPDLSMIAAELRGLAQPIDSLIPDPRNAKIHGDRNLAAIKASYQRFGQRKNIVAVAGTNVVIAGNGQLAAAKALGWTHVAVSYFADEPSARAFALADNRTSEIDVAWDAALLQESLAELDSLDLDLGELGFSDDDLAKLLEEPSGVSDQPSAAPKPRAANEDPPPANYAEQYGVIVLCESEDEQRETYEALVAEGRNCRVVTT
jgi:ParB family transcriptional regulator, chromosome partitioning protein